MPSRLLIVDDDPEMREGLGHFFSGQGYELRRIVTEAVDGRRHPSESMRAPPPPCHTSVHSS